MRAVVFLLCLGVALAHERGNFEHIIEINREAGHGDLFEGDIPCEDNPMYEETKCSEWASWGQCEDNPDFMWYYCRMTCGKCDWFPTVDAIYAAFDQYNEHTCIRWVPRTTETDYAHISRSYGGCWSYVGRLGGKQDLSLGEGCESTKTAVHEMMHCAGFYHTQSRTDRDYYVNIYEENMYEGTEYNFAKYTADQVDLYGYYDLYSIMHYDCYSFSKNNEPTITAKNDPSCNTPLGQPYVGGGFRQSDIDKLNSMYNC
ncbi:PREDICTED: astacin-like metalloprotease toxin 5 [Priapulus caudatus]|uniref:Metalloendopeptidase n=1 Tax=Priapulus caudatus TaxID=37621 RepID=A0ABM1DV67_PRICU|nr:PREDICTED: astacin-like metalloprotease toxin 5 [Priapulus caudatus]